jgi:hypothetical protein
MKRFPVISIVTAIAITVTSFISCQSSGKSSAAKVLKFNLEKGKGYDYELDWDMTTSVMNNKTDINIGALYSLNVIDDKDHIRTLTSTYRNFRMLMNVMGHTVDIDTDKPPVDGDDKSGIPTALLNKVFSGIVGKSFTMKVDEEGNILEISGLDDLVKGMIDSLNIDEDKKANIMASLKDQFNDQEVKNQFSDMLMVFPNKEVKVGDTWTKSFTKSGKMQAKYTTDYTVKQIEGDHVTLDAKTRIESAGQGNLSGEQTGTLIIDSRTGLMVNGDFKQDITVKTQGVDVMVEGKGKIKGKAN